MKDQIQSAQIIVTCKSLSRTLEFFTEKLDFRLEMIFPADAPSTAVISGFGTTLRLKESNEIQPVTLYLSGDFPFQKSIEFENMRFIFEDRNALLVIPEGHSELVISTLKSENAWHKGRAEMEYRDLIPSRLGGRFIASHIRIAKGGPVSDYVHFHQVRFQMIFCLSGWARLVYEDQGAPLLMKAGDCILQPPEIRHQVLECSDHFEVLEIGSPAVHPTFVDYQMNLPNDKFNPERIFSEQSFVHHIAEKGVWTASEFENIESCDTRIGEASKGLAEVRTLRATANTNFLITHSGEFLFFFVLQGNLNLSDQTGKTYRLEKGSGFVLPKDSEYLIEAIKGSKMVRVSL